jgi:hypothetical protein
MVNFDGRRNEDNILTRIRHETNFTWACQSVLAQRFYDICAVENIPEDNCSENIFPVDNFPRILFLELICQEVICLKGVCWEDYFPRFFFLPKRHCLGGYLPNTCHFICRYIMRTDVLQANIFRGKWEHLFDAWLKLEMKNEFYPQFWLILPMKFAYFNHSHG